MTADFIQQEFFYGAFKDFNAPSVKKWIKSQLIFILFIVNIPQTTIKTVNSSIRPSIHPSVRPSVI